MKPPKQSGEPSRGGDESGGQHRALPVAGNRCIFHEAFRRELVHSGYTIEEAGPLTVSGTITRFFVDWREDIERLFELHAVYTVGSIVKNGFAWECSSIQRGPNTLAQDSVLIRKGTADCMQRFIRAAQDAHVL